MNAGIEELRSIVGSREDRVIRARRAAEWVRAAGDYHWIGIYDVDDSNISAIAWTGSNAPAHPTFARTKGLNGVAVASGEPVVVQDVHADPRYLTTFGATLAEAIFPVRSREREIVGTLDVDSDRVNAFTAQDEEFLGDCAAALLPLWD